MDRPITGFATDDQEDPVALLACGHRQHVRHQPPFQERPWVTTEEGRRSKLGAPLDCVRCDRLEMPEGLIAYKRTPDFDERTVPDALRADHRTRAGVWAKIVVLEGRLRYVVDALGHDLELAPEHPGIVAPEVAHRIDPLGSTRFFVEFHRAAP